MEVPYMAKFDVFFKKIYWGIGSVVSILNFDVDNDTVFVQNSKNQEELISMSTHTFSLIFEAIGINKN